MEIQSSAAHSKRKGTVAAHPYAKRQEEPHGYHGVATHYLAWRLHAASPTAVQEGRERFPFTERHLQCIWYDPALRPAFLQTDEEETVHVLNPGFWNLEAGPDFLDAELVIEPDTRHVRGDVEIHIYPRDWLRHKHAQDPRYRQVIAHITYFPASSLPLHLPAHTLQIALQPLLNDEHPLDIAAIDVAAYPYAARMQPCPCARIMQQHAHRLSPQTVLQAAGSYRFQTKVQELEQQLRPFTLPDVLYRNTMRNMGYKSNQRAFLELADAVPVSQLQGQPPLQNFARLLGMAGLLPADLQPSTANLDARQFLRLVWDAWWPIQTDGTPLPAGTWARTSTRPANTPERRLAGIAILFARQHPWQEIAKMLQGQQPLVPALTQLLEPHPALDFWLRHATFRSRTQPRQTALIGPARLAAWLNNTLLPLAVATREITLQTAMDLTLPEASNSVIRETASRILGSDQTPQTYAGSGIRQQGLIQIYADFCQNGCQNCRLHTALEAEGETTNG